MDIQALITKANQNTLNDEEKSEVIELITKELHELSSSNPEKYYEVLKIINESLSNINSSLRRV